MHINTLVVEVTRRCNMACEHCLRGKAQNCNIPLEHIDVLFAQVDYVGSIVFTGGEPSLNVEAIEHTLEVCKNNRVEVGSFYIATNGLKVPTNFVIACIKWFAYCDEKEMCRVEVSNDGYHAQEGNYSTELLSGLSFFSRKHELEQDWYSNGIINQGLAEENGIGARDIDDHDIENLDLEGIEDTEIYLNVKGDIILGCDRSYSNQEDNILCKVVNLQETIERLSDEY